VCKRESFPRDAFTNLMKSYIASFSWSQGRSPPRRILLPCPSRRSRQTTCSSRTFCTTRTRSPFTTGSHSGCKRSYSGELGIVIMRCFVFTFHYCYLNGEALSQFAQAVLVVSRPLLSISTSPTMSDRKRSKRRAHFGSVTVWRPSVLVR